MISILPAFISTTIWIKKKLDKIIYKQKYIKNKYSNKQMQNIILLNILESPVVKVFLRKSLNVKIFLLLLSTFDCEV